MSTYRILLAAVLISVVPAHAQKPGDKVPGRYIVELRRGTPALAVAATHGVAPDVVYTDAIQGFAGSVPAARLAALKADADVIAVTEDRVIDMHAPKNGGGNPGGGGGTPPPAAEVLPAGVERVGAIPGLMPYTGAGVGVAVVDTGLDMNHRDLRLGSKSVKVVVSGIKLKIMEGATAGQDDNGHGTHVGGIIAARLDGFDVIGVAPEATLYAVKVLDGTGRGYDSSVMGGLDWVARNAADVSPRIKVVNMSLGRPGTINDNPSYRAAVKRLHDLGITVVVSAGNDPSLEVSQIVPATYPEVIAVASTTAKNGAEGNGTNIAADAASYFTTDGPFDSSTGMGVSISAPGEEREDVVSGWIQSVGILSTWLGGGTTRMSGTSMASPHTAGVVALLYGQAGGDLDPETARARIMSGASGADSAPLNSPTSNYSFDGVREGVLDALGATGVSPAFSNLFTVQ